MSVNKHEHRFAPVGPAFRRTKTRTEQGWAYRRNRRVRVKSKNIVTVGPLMRVVFCGCGATDTIAVVPEGARALDKRYR